MFDRQEIAASWIKYANSPPLERTENNPHFWACEELQDLIRNDPANAWAVIEAMWAMDSSERILANIASGPVEEILCLHGAAVIEKIEVTAEKDAVFKKLLGAVWQNTMPESIWKRVKTVAGDPF